MKKSIFAAVLLVLLVALAAIPAAAEEETTVIGGKTFRLISTAEEFEAMNGGNNYILSADIDFSGKTYAKYVVPAHFYGILDGNGHSLLGLSLSATEAGAGIFNTEFQTDATGTVLRAEDENGVMQDLAASGFTYTVRNLTVGSAEAPAQFVSTANNLGVFAGYAVDESIFEFSNVTVYANVSSDGQQVGGFVGRIMPNRLINRSTFTNCKVYGSVTAKKANVGSYVGYSANPMYFSNCANYAAVTSEGSNNVGGFVGINYNAKYTGITMENCVNEGKIVAVNCVGGFIGKGQYSHTLNSCVNKGEIAAKGTHVGGFVGYELCSTAYLHEITLTLEHCENAGTVSSESKTANVGGFVGAILDNLLVSDCVNNGTITNGKFVGGIVGLFDPQAKVKSTDETTGETVYDTFTATLTGCVNNGEIKPFTTASGAYGGILGGTSWGTGRFFTVNIDRCTNNGTVEDFSGGIASRLGGILGRFTSGAGVLTVTNCVNRGALKGTAADDVSGILGYTNCTVNAATAEEVPEEQSATIRRMENCLNLGVLTRGGETAPTYAIAKNYVDSGTLLNCFYLQETAGKAYFGNGNENDDLATAAAVTEEELASGEIAYLLGAAFGQQLGTDAIPAVGGNAVLKNGNGALYNSIHTHDFGENPYTSLNAGSHTRVCNICGETVSEAHKFGEYIDNGEGKHYHVCELCGYQSTPQAHTCSEHTDNGDGTHTGVCSVCGATVTEAHDYRNGKCADCGAAQPAETLAGTETADAASEGEKAAGKGCKSSMAPVGAVLFATAAAVCLPTRKKKRGKSQ